MSVVNDLNQTEGLPVNEQTFAASIRNQALPSDTQELRDQLAYLRGESPTCPTVSPLQDCDVESEGNAMACAAAIVLGSVIGLGLLYLFWCLL